MGDFGLSLLAGILTTLSPCVIPLLPLIVGSALNENKFGPLALASGLALSFAVLGMLLAASGTLLGISSQALRIIAAAILICAGLVLVVPFLKRGYEKLLAPISNWASKKIQNPKLSGLGGQFCIGALLGMLWGPCSGPTLGVAIGLAVQDGGRLHAFAMMLLFGLGATIPLLIVAYGSRQVLKAQSLRGFFSKARTALGVLMIVVGVFVGFGWDKTVEAKLIDYMPEWMLDLTTTY